MWSGNETNVKPDLYFIINRLQIQHIEPSLQATCTSPPGTMDLATIGTITVLLAAALLQLDYVAAIPLHDFYPYGAVNGDQALPKSNDGSSPAIQLEVPFRFFSRERSTIYVSQSELHWSIFDDAKPQKLYICNSSRMHSWRKLSHRTML